MSTALSSLANHAEASADAWLASVLRDDVAGALETAAAGDTAVRLRRAAEHGVGSLVLERLQHADTNEEERQRLRVSTQSRAMWELRHVQLLRVLLAAFADAGVRPVIFKGTALAYTLYANPVLRERADTDLIVAETDQAKAIAVLTQLGYTRDLRIGGTHVGYQASFTLQSVDGQAHAIDLHWRISNSELLSRLFTHEELHESARPAPRLAPTARVVSPVHAFLIACMHRASHRHNPYWVDGVALFGGERLIWLYDLHLLAGALTSSQWQEALALAAQKGLRATCAEAMRRCSSVFSTAYPEGVLDSVATGIGYERAADYLSASVLRQQWLDLRALPDMATRMRFLGETLLPQADYMRERYPDVRPGWLPWLHLRRILLGGMRRLARRGAWHD